YPVDIRQTFVKRAIGVPGDHIRLIKKKLILNGHPVDEPYVYNKDEFIDGYRDNFPGDPNVHVAESAIDMLTSHVQNGEVVVPPLAPAIPPQRLWGLTNEHLRDIIVEQLPGIPKKQILAEPAQRNTAPAIGLAAHILHSVDRDAVMAVLPADHVIGKPAAYRG